MEKNNGKHIRTKFSCKEFTLNNVSFTITAGFNVGMNGQNDASKTTNLMLIINIIRKNSGEINVFGKDNIEHEE